MVFCVKKFIMILHWALVLLVNIADVFYNLLRLICIEKLKDNFEILLKNDKAVFALIRMEFFIRYEFFLALLTILFCSKKREI